MRSGYGGRAGSEVRAVVRNEARFKFRLEVGIEIRGII